RRRVEARTLGSEAGASAERECARQRPEPAEQRTTGGNHIVLQKMSDDHAGPPEALLAESPAPSVPWMMMAARKGRPHAQDVATHCGWFMGAFPEMRTARCCGAPRRRRLLWRPRGNFVLSCISTGRMRFETSAAVFPSALVTPGTL